MWGTSKCQDGPSSDQLKEELVYVFRTRALYQLFSVGGFINTYISKALFMVWDGRSSLFSIKEWKWWITSHIWTCVLQTTSDLLI